MSVPSFSECDRLNAAPGALVSCNAGQRDGVSTVSTQSKNIICEKRGYKRISSSFRFEHIVQHPVSKGKDKRPKSVKDNFMHIMSPVCFHLLFYPRDRSCFCAINRSHREIHYSNSIRITTYMQYLRRNCALACFWSAGAVVIVTWELQTSVSVASCTSGAMKHQLCYSAHLQDSEVDIGYAFKFLMPVTERHEQGEDVVVAFSPHLNYRSSDSNTWNNLITVFIYFPQLSNDLFD